MKCLNPEILFLTLDTLAQAGLNGPLTLELSKPDWTSLMSDEEVLVRRFGAGLKALKYDGRSITFEHPLLKTVRIQKADQ